MSVPELSIIIPCLNEGTELIQHLTKLHPLRQQGVEVIVVDGGSRGNALTDIPQLCDQYLSSSTGRGLQMNTGAAVASGQRLLFLHADTTLPEDAVQLITEALQQAEWGRFDVRLNNPHWSFKIIAWFINQRSRYTRVATGDQGLFFRRDFFTALGGFPAIPLMEDVAISKRARHCGRYAALKQRVITSARRWEQHGTLRTIWLMWALRLRYFCGQSPEQLAKRYYG